MGRKKQKVHLKGRCASSRDVVWAPLMTWSSIRACGVGLESGMGNLITLSKHVGYTSVQVCNHSAHLLPIMAKYPVSADMQPSALLPMLLVVKALDVRNEKH